MKEESQQQLLTLVKLMTHLKQCKYHEFFKKATQWFILFTIILTLLPPVEGRFHHRRLGHSKDRASHGHKGHGHMPESKRGTHRHSSIVREGILERVPPSRPAPHWDSENLQPSFENVTRTRVVTAAGHTAHLHCRIRHLGDRVVTWIRKRDVHVLTVGLFPYTTDDRFTALHSESSDDWTLRIASAQVSDTGIYECQVSTEPKISKAFILHVVEAQAHIDGPGEIHMMSGSNINLTCRVTGTPDPPQHIYWFLGKTLVNYSSRGGISVVTDKHSGTSRLLVTRSTPQDSGNYSCVPANAKKGTVSVYILNGEHPAAMQGGESTSLRCPSLQVFILPFIVHLSTILQR